MKEIKMLFIIFFIIVIVNTFKINKFIKLKNNIMFNTKSNDIKSIIKQYDNCDDNDALCGVWKVYYMLLNIIMIIIIYIIIIIINRLYIQVLYLLLLFIIILMII